MWDALNARVYAIFAENLAYIPVKTTAQTAVLLAPLAGNPKVPGLSLEFYKLFYASTYIFADVINSLQFITHA